MKDVPFINPKCMLSGCKEKGSGEAFDIKLEIVVDDSGTFCPKGKGCPFTDVHGLPLEVHNHE